MTKAAVFCLAAGMASAQTVSLTVNTGRVLHGIDEKIYGQFLEHIYHSVNGGLWGDMVWNRQWAARQRLGQDARAERPP
jgi:alpha-N-arabinofuranosidase